MLFKNSCRYNYLGLDLHFVFMVIGFIGLAHSWAGFFLYLNGRYNFVGKLFRSYQYQ